MFVAGDGMNVENKITTAAGLCVVGWRDGAAGAGGDGVVVLPGRRVSVAA